MLEHIRDEKATQADVDELQSIQLGLEKEFNSYPAEMQNQLRESKGRLVAHLTKLRTQLAAQLKLKQSQPRRTDDLQTRGFGFLSLVDSSAQSCTRR